MSTQRTTGTADDVAGSLRPPERDPGATLVEITISVVLIGILLSALLAAVQLSVRSSSIAFTGAEVETVLLNAGDRIDRAPQLCTYEEYVDAAALAGGWPVESTTVAVEKLDPDNGSWSAQKCPADISPFEVQRLTITATDPDGRVTRTLTVVKSDVN